MIKRQKNRRKTCLSVLGITLGLVSLALLLVGLMRSWQDGLRPIPNGPLHGSIPADQRFISARERDETGPIYAVMPQHPFMAAGWGNNMHNDAYMSDTYGAIGPLGRNPKIVSRTQGFGGYGTIAFDRAGRLVAVYSNAAPFPARADAPDYSGRTGLLRPARAPVVFPAEWGDAVGVYRGGHVLLSGSPGSRRDPDHAEQHPGGADAGAGE